MVAANQDAADAQGRYDHRVRTRALEIHTRSARGGFLYLLAWLPLGYAAGYFNNAPWNSTAITLVLVLLAWIRMRSRPPKTDAAAQSRWISRYVLICLATTLIWSAVQAWILLDDMAGVQTRNTTLMATIAFASVFAHLYTPVMRLALAGIVMLLVPVLAILWMDSAEPLMAAAMSVFSIYLVNAAYRSRADFRRRLDLDDALRGQRDQYEKLSQTDALTGLSNRRTFAETLNGLVREAQWLQGAGVALVLLDIDHFKSINDRHGHVIGDEVLRRLARKLHRMFSADDVMVARIGGEEFALILRDVDEVSATIRAEAFREALEAQPIACAGINVPVTVSMGVGSFHAARDRDDDGFYAAVDVALYAAKQQGRNRVVSISMLEPGRIRARRGHGAVDAAPTPQNDDV